MSLILDHVNGIRDDNRLENLRIVCPNCAATLDTHCGRNVNGGRRCALCGDIFTPKHREQIYCSNRCGSRSEPSRLAQRALRRVERPPYERLVAEIDATGYCAVGRKYGVSDNAIRKWVRQYERERAPAEANRRDPGWVLVSGERFEEILRRERAGMQGFEDVASEDHEIHARVRQLLARAG